MRRDRDKGSPCRIPRVDPKWPKELPLRRMENDAVERQEWIHLIKIKRNPRRFKTWRIGDHSILSNTLSISTLIAISPPLSLLCLIVWKASAARVEFSCMILPLTKVDW